MKSPLPLKALPLLAAGALLAGCGADTARSFGLTRDAPDEFQVTTRAPLSMPPPEVVERTRAQSPDSPTQGWLLWQAMCRKLDREQPEYRS